jgi:uncharacterized protein YjbJ (UPF0337 family)
VNKDFVKGTVKDIAGKAQQILGKLTGSPKQKAKGTAKRAVGKTQKGVGRVRSAAAKSARQAERGRAR